MSDLLDNLINARFYSVNGVVQARRQTVDFAGVGVSVAHDAVADKMTVTVTDDRATPHTLTTTDDTATTIATLTLEAVKVYAVTVEGLAVSSATKLAFKSVFKVTTEIGSASESGTVKEVHDKLTPWVSSVDCTGLSCAIQLTGAAGTTVKWAVRISTQEVAGFMPA